MSYGKLTTLLMSILIAVVGLCVNLMADTDYGEEILEKRTESSRTYYKDGIYTCVSMSNQSIDKNKTNQLSSMTTDYIDPLVAITVSKYRDGTIDSCSIPMLVGSEQGSSDSMNCRVFIRYPLYSIDDTMCIYNVDDYHLTSNDVRILEPNSVLNVGLRNCSPILMNVLDYQYTAIWDGISYSPILTSGEFGSGSTGQSLDVNVEDLVKSIHNNKNHFFLLGLKTSYNNECFYQGYVKFDSPPALIVHYCDTMISSGEMNKSQIWPFPHSLTGDLTVPSGKTLTINSSVDLQGHTLLSTGGSIILGANGSISSHYYIKQNGSLKGFCPNLQSAINNIGSCDEIEVGQAFSLIQNTTIPSGAYIRLLNSINLAGYRLFAPGGILTNSSISGWDAIVGDQEKIIGLYSSLSDALIFAQEDGYSIALNSKTYSQNFNLNGCSLHGIFGGGTVINGNITASGNSIVRIQDLNIGSHSITFNNCQANASRVDNNGSSSAIRCYNSSYFTIDQFQSTNSNPGTSVIDAYNSQLYLTCSQIQNKFIGVYTSGNTSLSSIRNHYCGNDLDISHNASGDASSLRDTLSVQPPYCFSGDVDTCMFRICTQLLLKNSDVSVDLNNSIEKSSNSIREIDRQYHLLLQKIHQDMKENSKCRIKEFQNDVSEIAGLYHNLASTDLLNETYLLAIARVVQCYRLMEDWDGLKLILDQFSQSNKYQKRIPYLKRQEVYYYLGVKDYKSALSVISELRESSIEDKTLLGELIYEEGLIHKYNLKEPLQARIAFEELMKSYPDHPLSKFAETESQDLVSQDEWNRYLEDKKTDINGTEEVGFSCSSYPNPFNMSTRIQYAIPEYGQVQVVVYDLLGRTVRELVKQDQGKGQYEVEWNGCNQNGAPVSSGIYFYRVQWNNRTHSDKLIMLK